MKQQINNRIQELEAPAPDKKDREVVAENTVDVKTETRFYLRNHEMPFEKTRSFGYETLREAQLEQQARGCTFVIVECVTSISQRIVANLETLSP